MKASVHAKRAGGADTSVGSLCLLTLGLPGDQDGGREGLLTC